MNKEYLNHCFEHYVGEYYICNFCKIMIYFGPFTQALYIANRINIGDNKLNLTCEEQQIKNLLE